MKKTIYLILALVLLLCACAENEIPKTDNSIPVQGTEEIPETPTEQEPEAIPPEPEVEPNPEPDPEPEPEPQPEPQPTPPDPREETVDAILSGMTLEEKVGQLFFARCPAADQVEQIGQYHPGGYILFTRDFKNESGEWLTEEEFTAKIASYQAASTIPMLIGVDEEGGTVIRASRNPNLFPEKRKSPQEIYAAGGTKAILADTLYVNSRLLELGINVNFGPVADFGYRENTFIYDRTIALNPTKTGEYVAAVVQQMKNCEADGEIRPIGSVLKHFPGYGDCADTHTGVVVDDRDIRYFLENDFYPFFYGIEAGADAVMLNHNIVQCLDRNYPASLSPRSVRYLREAMKFKGVIITDDLAMEAVKEYAENGEAAVLALQAGVTMILTTDFAQQIDEVLGALKDGSLTEEQIDAAVRIVLRWKYDLGLLGE